MFLMDDAPIKEDKERVATSSPHEVDAGSQCARWASTQRHGHCISLYYVCANALERSMIYDCHNERSSPCSPPGGRPDAGRTRNAKALWLVQWPWPRQVDAGVQETGLQTDVAVGQLCNPWGGWWWHLLGAWILDTSGCSR